MKQKAFAVLGLGSFGMGAANELSSAARRNFDARSRTHVVGITPTVLCSIGCIDIVVVANSDGVCAGVERTGAQLAPYLLVVQSLCTIGDHGIPCFNISHIPYGTRARIIICREPHLDIALVGRGKAGVLLAVLQKEDCNEAEQYGRNLFQLFRIFSRVLLR